MTELQRIRERRMDGCMETLEYYCSEFLDKGKSLNAMQLEDYKEKCYILQCMGGDEVNEYAKLMLSYI